MLIILYSLIQPAFALDSFAGVETSLPASGAIDAAVNIGPAVQMQNEDIDTLTLIRDDDGAAVTGTVESYGSVSQFVPAAPLDANTSYSLMTTPGRHLGVDEDGTITRFTTGTAEDVDPPSAPTITDVTSSHISDDWGDWFTFSVDINPSADASGIRYAVELSFDPCPVSEGTDVQCQALPRPAEEHFLLPGDAASQSLEFIRDPAGNNDDGADFDPHSTLVIIRAIDLAGNESGAACAIPEGWDVSATPCAGVENTFVIPAPPEDPDSGCSTVSGTSSSAAFMLSLFALLGLRRRR